MSSQLSISQRFKCVYAIVIVVFFVIGWFVDVGGVDNTLSIFLLVGASVLLVTLFSLAKSIQSMIQMITQAMREDRLDKNTLVGSGPMAKLTQDVVAYRDRVSHVVHDVNNQADVLETSCELLGALAESMNQSAIMQKDSVDKVREDISHLAESIESEGEQVSSASSAAQEAKLETEEGGKIVLDTVSGIEQLAIDVSEAAGVINQLDDDSKNIGSVLDVIRGIAEQTNLLALNAAIEAARAGESGRGFAVVADEVRTLASRTQQSTEEIQATIEKLQQGAQKAVDKIEHGRRQAEQTVEQASKATGALVSIATSVAAISDINQAIHSATDEQQAFVKSVINNIELVNEQAVDTAARAEKASEATTELSGLAEQLKLSVKGVVNAGS